MTQDKKRPRMDSVLRWGFPVVSVMIRLYRKPPSFVKGPDVDLEPKISETSKQELVDTLEEQVKGVREESALDRFELTQFGRWSPRERHQWASAQISLVDEFQLKPKPWVMYWVEGVVYGGVPKSNLNDDNNARKKKKKG